jgi:hypothetical protein
MVFIYLKLIVKLLFESEAPILTNSYSVLREKEEEAQNFVFTVLDQSELRDQGQKYYKNRANTYGH